jgi:hypothetical protein
MAIDTGKVCPCSCKGVVTADVAVPRYVMNLRSGVFRARTSAELQAMANRNIRRKAALFYGAGVIAQLIHDGVRSPHLGPIDPIVGCDSIVADLIGERFKRADGTYQDAIALEVDKYRRQAWTLLKKPANWRAVESLASALLAEQAITGERAFAILRDGRGRGPRLAPIPQSAQTTDERVLLSDSLENFLREVGRRLDAPEGPG